MANKTMEIEILSDGTVKCETGDMSGPAHKVADDFIKMLEQMLGGETEHASTKHGHTHAHDHDHEHGGNHHHH